jgi:DNA processing protein
LIDRIYWLGFSLVPKIGPKSLARLLNGFGSLPAAWSASELQLRQAGLDGQALNNLLRVRSEIDLDREIAKIERTGARFLTLTDDEYPTLLKTLPEAPPVLYIRGSLGAEDNRALSIVGTRKPTAYGRDAAYSLSKQLAARDVTIISGLAQGIDAAAHRGALDAGGRTIAVLGSGIDQLYPRENTGLAQEIAKHGALISEFPMGAPPEGRNFPRRNRIISGLSLGVLVVEAPEKSGALITAITAAEQGREVFAVPGNIFSQASSGTNRLIQDGAKLVMDVDDILDELKITHTAIEIRKTTEQIAPANPLEAQLVDCLSAEPLHIDEIVRMSGLSAAVVSSTLTILELKGIARMVGHMQYHLLHTNERG